MKAPEKFSFDWILESNENRKAECLDFYTKNGCDIVLLSVQTNFATPEWIQKYEVGNPLLGGVRTYRSYKRARAYFDRIVGLLDKKGE